MYRMETQSGILRLRYFFEKSQNGHYEITVFMYCLESEVGKGVEKKKTALLSENEN